MGLAFTGTSGFALYVLRNSTNENSLPPICEWPSDDRLVHSPSLAAAGYALARGLATEHEAAWLAGIDRLKGREPFPTDRQSFAFRPLELLGISVGIARYSSTSAPLAKWLGSILRRSRKEHADDPWAAGLQYAAERAMGVTGGRFRTVEESVSVEDLAMLRWISKEFGIAVDGATVTRRILEQSATQTLGNVDLPHAAVVYSALHDSVRETIQSEVERHWQVGRSERDATELVVSLCRRFHLFAEQLKTRHAGRDTLIMNDEYDVQDAMHALLRLHFDDVRAEEVTPSVAGKSGRMDFLLKQERIAVETKMTRPTLDQKKVGDELIVDMRRYRAHPDVHTLICLVYDPKGHCHAPAALERDLSAEEADLRTVIVVCPKGM